MTGQAEACSGRTPAQSSSLGLVRVTEWRSLGSYGPRPNIAGSRGGARRRGEGSARVDAGQDFIGTTEEAVSGNE